MVNASFPDYESVIPKDNDQVMVVDCKVLVKQLIGYQQFLTKNLEL